MGFLQSVRGRSGFGLPGDGSWEWGGAGGRVVRGVRSRGSGERRQTRIVGGVGGAGDSRGVECPETGERAGVEGGGARMRERGMFEVNAPSAVSSY